LVQSPPYVEWSFKNINDAHEMTPPSPQRPYNLMLMTKRRHECWWNNKDLVTSSTTRCHQGWKVAHFNTFAKEIAINKISKEWKKIIFFPVILKGFSQWDYIIKIDVLDINALFNVHVIEYWDNSILYWN
jgi:hypothetical protein